MKKKRQQYSISKIDINIGILKGFSQPQFIITIDDVSLNDYLNTQTNSNDFDLLVPPIQMFNTTEQNKVLDLLSYVNIPLPVLICMDDMDFSCIVVSAYVVEDGDVVVWKNYGYGLDMSNSIQAKLLAFEKANYKAFVEKFRQFIIDNRF